MINLFSKTHSWWATLVPNWGFSYGYYLQWFPLVIRIIIKTIVIIKGWSCILGC